jgi:hypothetical protein
LAIPFDKAEPDVDACAVIQTSQNFQNFLGRDALSDSGKYLFYGMLMHIRIEIGHRVCY